MDVIIVIIFLIAAVSLELKAARLIRIARAILEEQRKANESLAYLTQREFEKAQQRATKKEPANAEPEKIYRL